jgi:hypothetical protein
MNFGSFHGVNAEHFPTGQKVVVKIDGYEVNGVVISHDGRHGVDVKLNTQVIVKTITVTKRFFRKDLVEIAVECFDQKSFFETEVGVVKDDGRVQYYTVFGGQSNV